MFLFIYSTNLEYITLYSKKMLIRVGLKSDGTTGRRDAYLQFIPRVQQYAYLVVHVTCVAAMTAASARRRRPSAYC